MKITDEESLNEATDKLLDTGLERVFIRLGENGAMAMDKNQKIHLPAIPTEVKNTTGAGDAFMGGLGWAYTQGLDLEETAKAGIAAATIALEGEQTINPEMNEAELLELIRSQSA